MPDVARGFDLDLTACKARASFTGSSRLHKRGRPWSPDRYVLTIVECQIPVTIIAALLLGLRWVLRG